jgi:allantoin racemase
MRIKIIEPVLYNESNIEKIRDLYNQTKRETTSIDVIGLKKGAADIEYFYDEEIAKIELLREVKKAEKEDFDGILIYCTGDPGLDAAREIVEIPVVGLGQVELHLAALLCSRFTVLSPGSSVMVEELIRKYGLKEKLKETISVDLTVSQVKNKNLAKKTALKALKGKEMEALVLECGHLMGLAEELSHELGVPVIGPEVGVPVLESLIASSLSQSKKVYMNPSDKKRVF